MFIGEGEDHSLADFAEVAGNIRATAKRNIELLHNLGHSCIETEKEILREGSTHIEEVESLIAKLCSVAAEQVSALMLPLLLSCHLV